MRHRKYYVFNAWKLAIQYIYSYANKRIAGAPEKN